jgi:hypothetical protein
MDKPHGFAYHPKFVAPRPHPVRSSLFATFAVIVSACSGTVRGVGPDAPAGLGQSTSPDVSRGVRGEGLALRSGGSFGASSVASTTPAAAASSDDSVPNSSQPDNSLPPADGGAATEPPAPPAPYDPREKQIELLTDAVMALRQEVGRSYEHSQRLTQENEKLRGVVAGLRRELAKEKGGSKVLREQLESLEKRMRELEPPPLEPPNEAGASAPSAPAPNASNPSPETGEAADTGAPRPQ